MNDSAHFIFQYEWSHSSSRIASVNEKGFYCCLWSQWIQGILFFAVILNTALRWVLFCWLRKRMEIFKKNLCRSLLWWLVIFRHSSHWEEPGGTTGWHREAPGGCRVVGLGLTGHAIFYNTNAQSTSSDPSAGLCMTLITHLYGILIGTGVEKSYQVGWGTWKHCMRERWKSMVCYLANKQSQKRFVFLEINLWSKFQERKKVI